MAVNEYKMVDSTVSARKLDTSIDNYKKYVKIVDALEIPLESAEFVKVNDKLLNSEFSVDCSSEKCNRGLDLNMNENENEELSEIQQFYSGKHVLITGSTGFLGKVLVEKLLRRCQGVETLYLLVRQKRGKDVYTRIDEIFDDPVFDKLKQEVPKFRHKVVVMPGDCEAPGLGLSLEDRHSLIEKVNVIVHSAATVKFDEHLRAALATNVKAPLHLLDLARDMKGLNALIHISTAFSYPYLPLVEEKFYPNEISLEKLYKQVEKLSDPQIENILPKILGPWPNTYTFTKALAENELRENAAGVPLGIFRPAIVTSTAKEPLKCWIDNMYGPTGICVGCVTGMIHSLHCSADVTADIVPVDYVVNCIMAAALSVHKAYKSSTPPLEPPIFNYVSSVENKLTWGDFMVHNISRIDLHPFSNAVWYAYIKLNSSRLLHKIYIFFLHLLPAALIDAIALCLGKKPEMLRVYRRIHKFTGVLSYFSTRDMTFCNRRTRALWQHTSHKDKQLFPFSMSDINWSDYFDSYLAGIRRYLFKDSDDTLPQARIKWRRLYYLHQIVKYLVYFLAFYLLWSVLKIIF